MVRGNMTTDRGIVPTKIVRVALQVHGPSGKFLQTGGELVW